MYDCKQLEDVTSLENVHMFTEILSQIFVRCCYLNRPPLSSVVPQAFGALELKGQLYMTSYRMFTCRPFFHASNFTSNLSMDSALITRLSLYNPSYGQSVLKSMHKASYITIKSSGIRPET